MVIKLELTQHEKDKLIVVKPRPLIKTLRFLMPERKNA